MVAPQASRSAIRVRLLACGATITAYDPVAMDAARTALGNTTGVQMAESQKAALQGADALIIVTEWKAFRSPDFEHIKASLKKPLIFDGRNMYDPQWVRAQGFEYLAIGR